MVKNMVILLFSLYFQDSPGTYILKPAVNITFIVCLNHAATSISPTLGLELAEMAENMSCYNILAPSFNVPLKEGGHDANPRESRLAERLMPRVELVTFSDESVLSMSPMAETVEWLEVIAAVKDLKQQSNVPLPETSQLKVRIENLCFQDDATQEQVDLLFEEVAGMMSIEANACTIKTESSTRGVVTFLIFFASYVYVIIIHCLLETARPQIPTDLSQKNNEVGVRGQKASRLKQARSV